MFWRRLERRSVPALALIAALSFVAIPAVRPSLADADGRLSWTPRLSLTRRTTDSLRREPPLRGSVLLYHVFVNRAHARWSAFDTRQVVERVHDGLQFVDDQAERYGVTVSWSHEWAFVSLDEMPSDLRADRSWIESAVEGASGHSSADLVAELEGREGVDHAVVVVHLDGEGISFCWGWARQAVVFNRTAPLHWRGASLSLGARTHAYSQPSVYVHELLHAFGAEDLYQPDERATRARRCSPDDVMLIGSADLSALSIGEKTAASLGWRTARADDCR